MGGCYSQHTATATNLFSSYSSPPPLPPTLSTTISLNSDQNLETTFDTKYNATDSVDCLKQTSSAQSHKCLKFEPSPNKIIKLQYPQQRPLQKLQSLLEKKKYALSLKKNDDCGLKSDEVITIVCSNSGLSISQVNSFKVNYVPQVSFVDIISCQNKESDTPSKKSSRKGFSKLNLNRIRKSLKNRSDLFTSIRTPNGMASSNFKPPVNQQQKIPSVDNVVSQQRPTSHFSKISSGFVRRQTEQIHNKIVEENKVNNKGSRLVAPSTLAFKSRIPALLPVKKSTMKQTSKSINNVNGIVDSSKVSNNLSSLDLINSTSCGNLVSSLDKANSNLKSVSIDSLNNGSTVTRNNKISLNINSIGRFQAQVTQTKSITMTKPQTAQIVPTSTLTKGDPNRIGIPDAGPIVPQRTQQRLNFLYGHQRHIPKHQSNNRLKSTNNHKEDNGSITGSLSQSESLFNPYKRPAATTNPVYHYLKTHNLPQVMNRRPNIIANPSITNATIVEESLAQDRHHTFTVRSKNNFNKNDCSLSNEKKEEFSLQTTDDDDDLVVSSSLEDDSVEDAPFADCVNKTTDHRSPTSSSNCSNVSTFMSGSICSTASTTSSFMFDATMNNAAILRNSSGVSSRSTTVSSQDSSSNKDLFLIDDEIADQPALVTGQLEQNKMDKVREQLSLNLSSCESVMSPTKTLTPSSSNTNTTNTNDSMLRHITNELDNLILQTSHMNNESVINSKTQANKPSGSNSKLKKRHSYTATSSSPVSSMPTLQFRRPRPLSFVEKNDGSFGLDSPSMRAVSQDLIGIKTLLFRLQNILQNAETQNPFESFFATNKSINLFSQKSPTITNQNDMVSVLKEENFDLKQHVQLLEQQMIEKDRTIRLLQQQMAKYTANYFEEDAVLNHQTKRETVNSTTQTNTESTRCLVKPSCEASNGQVIRISTFDSSHLM